jgi:hypothetical protein
MTTQLTLFWCPRPQAHKHSLARSCPRDVLAHLIAFATGNSSHVGGGGGKAATSAARPSRAAEGDEAAAAAGPAASTAAATQAKLLALLQSIGAGSSRRIDVQAGGSAAASGDGDSGGNGEYSADDGDNAANPPVAQPSASAAVRLQLMKKRAWAPSGQDQAQAMLQALLLARQRDVQVLNGKK